MRTRDNKYGAIYTLNYDLLRSTCSSSESRGSTMHNAADLPSSSRSFSSERERAITSDHRFFMSFTLAGLGNFSPFNGALSGVPR